jgi:hypothetical protein
MVFNIDLNAVSMPPPTASWQRITKPSWAKCSCSTAAQLLGAQKQQGSVSLSMTESKYIALMEVAKEALWLHLMLAWLLTPESHPLPFSMTTSPPLHF